MAATLPFVSNRMWCAITHRILDDPTHGVPLPIALYIRCPHVNERLHSRIIHPNETNHSTRNLPKRNRRGGACVPARTSAQRRFHAKNTCIVRGGLNDGCALVGRHWRAHRHCPYQSPPNHAVCHYPITPSHRTFDSSRQPRGVPLPHYIVHSIAPNHAVCHYPSGVILSIAQGWQVQRCLPWVTMQARRLPPWGLYFFSSHITTRGE